MTCMFERGCKARLLLCLQQAANEADALAMVGRTLDDRLEPLTSSAEREQLYHQVLKRLKHVTPERTRLKREDLYGAMALGG